jgi:lipid-A-disaccharide synthase
VAPMATPAARAAFERTLLSMPQAPPLRQLDGQARTALMAADVALVASGTATLEALLCRCPMVVAYRFATLTALLVRALRLVRVPYFALPNWLAGEKLVPEFLQEEVLPEPMAEALAALLAAAPRREYLLERFAAIHASLRQQGAALAAEAVIQCVRQKMEGRAR